MVKVNVTSDILKKLYELISVIVSGTLLLITFPLVLLYHKLRIRA